MSRLAIVSLVAMAVACRTPEPPPAQRVDAAVAPPPPPRMIVVQRKCMGTACEVKAFHHDDDLVNKAVEKGMAEMDRLEALMTSWKDTSEVSAINRAAGKDAVKVSPETLAVVKRALEIAVLTNGAFDVTVGVFRGLWKFDEDNDGSIPDPREVKKRLKLVNYKDVIVDEAAGTVKLRRPGQRLNLEGLAKGFAVDRAVGLIREAGLKDFIFHAGGDLFAAGRPGHRDWRVGIQDPRGTRGKIIYELSLSDKAFNTSGDYERFVMKDDVRYHHVLDARTGFPARGCRSVTLLADSAFLADALDTAIFTMGAERGMKVIEETQGLEGVIVDADNKIHVSKGLRERLKKRGEPTPGP